MDTDLVPRFDGRGSDYGVVHLRVDRGEGLESFLTRNLSVDSGRFEELNWLGAIYVNGCRADFKTQPRWLQVGDFIRVHTAPRRFDLGENLRSRIVKEANDYFIVDKPSGLPSHALVDNQRENLMTVLEEEVGEKLHITHRLDIETCGLIIVARTREAQIRINKGIAERKIKRFYKAWVQSPLTPGQYIHYMEPSPKAPKNVTEDFQEGWAKCDLILHQCQDSPIESLTQHWTLTEPQDLTLHSLDIEIKTGRPQQIRAQLSRLCAPIVGDIRYGSEVSLKDHSTQAPAIALRSDRLEGI